MAWLGHNVFYCMYAFGQLPSWLNVDCWPSLCTTVAHLNPMTVIFFPKPGIKIKLKMYIHWKPSGKARNVSLKCKIWSNYVHHSLLQIMFISPLMTGNLFWKATILGGLYRGVPLYLFFRNVTWLQWGKTAYKKISHLIYIIIMFSFIKHWSGIMMVKNSNWYFSALRKSARCPP